MTREVTRYEPKTIDLAPQPQKYDLIQIDDLAQLARTAWRRKWLIGFCVALAVGLGAAYYVLSTPLYRSTAQVLVVQKKPQDFPGMDPRASYLQDDMSTHMTVIKSPWFAEGVLKTPGLRSLRTLADQKSPRRAITRSLVVAQEKELGPHRPAQEISSILNLEFVGPDAEESRVILDAVLKRYRQFLSETSQKVNEDALGAITTKAEEAEKRLRRKELEYQEFRKRSPLLWNAKEGEGSYQHQMAEIESGRASANIRRSEIQTQLSALRRAQRDGHSRDEQLAMVPEESKWRTYTTLEEKLYPLLIEEKTLLKDFGPGHPQVKAVRDKIRFTRDFYAPSSKSRDHLVSEIGTQHDVRLEDPIQSHIRALEQELTAVEASEKALAEQFARKRDEAKEVANYELEDAQYSGEIARLSQYHDTLIKQLQGVNVSKDLVGYSMNLIAAPDYGQKVAPVAWMIGAVSLFLGGVSGLGLALLAEVSQKGLRSPDEIRHRLGLPVVGCIPRLSPNGRMLPRAGGDGASLDPILWTLYHPNSLEAEAYRGVRAALYFNTHGRPHRVIQITSPALGDGKSVLAANLAVSIAQSGRRTLLVDADLRRPRVHALFGRPASAGLATVLEDQADLEQVVQATEIPGLWILPSGPLPDHPADLLTSPRFQELLEEARRDYDFVLIDTPAILAVTDPRVVAPLVDGVLLTFRLSPKARPEVERAKQVLDDLQADLLGVVVNGADRYVEFTKYDS